MAIVTSCEKSDDNTTPPLIIDGVELPVSTPDSPTFAGSPVTIKGKGFTKTSEIWFRAVTKATDDVKATVTAVTETEITFTTPDAVGAQAIVLKQDGKEQILGEMFIAKELADAKLYNFVSTWEKPTELFEINKATGVSTKVEAKGLNSGEIYGDVAVIGEIAYAVSLPYTNGAEKESIIAFDFNTNTAKEFNAPKESRETILFNQDNKLYALVSSYETSEVATVSIAEINTTTGVFTTVYDLGSLSTVLDKTITIASVDDVYYDPTTKTVLGVGYYETEDVFNSFFLSIDLASNKYNVKDADSEYYAGVFIRKNEVYVSSVIYDEVTDMENSAIYSFDAKTLTVGAKIIDLKDQGAYSCLYDVKDDLLYTGSFCDFIDTYSFATKESKRITSDNELGALFLVR